MVHDTPFSFHCMICFEEFDPEDRYPVVLPCGHTYVCNVCANRLDKCMECRMPLYTISRPPKPQSSTTPVRATWSSNRGRSSVSSPPAEAPSPPQPPVKKRLPLPKNVVLLSLIEATELATEDVHKKQSEEESSTNSCVTETDIHMADNATQPAFEGVVRNVPVYTMNSMVDIEDDEEEKIKFGTSLAVGVAGTYAVARKEGMEIFPNRPTSSTSPPEMVQSTEEVDSLVNFPQHESKDSPRRAASLDEKDQARLSFGDRVQVVSMEGGWAKLARGYGYVRADKNQLVKVGGSVDRACKLEAMLRNLSHRRKELRVEQSKIDNQFVRLMKELQRSLQQDEDLTVILADAFDVSSDDEVVDAEKKEDDRAQAAAAVASAVADENDDDYGSIQKPSRLEQQITPAVTRSRPSFSCFAGEVFAGYSNDHDDSSELRSESNPTSPRRTSPRRAYSPSNLFPSASHPSPSALRAGAQAWREQNNQTPRTGTGIDFRTGMSGHMALLSTHAHPHEYLEPNNSYTGYSGYNTGVGSLRMSSHTGLTMSKFKLPTTSILSSLTLPTFGTSTQTEDRRDEVQQSGSM